MFCYNCMREKGDEYYCPYCGCENTADPTSHHLQPGTVLDSRYTLGRVLGEGGFGITYIGYDHLLDLRVAIKEFYPYGLSHRNIYVSDTVSVSAGKDDDTFEYRKQKFLSEAKTLARFSEEPGIVDISNFIKENNTAYIVMEYLDGIDLRNYLRQNGPMTVNDTLAILLPVMQSLDKIHAEGVIHRDISPDNLMVLQNGSVKLMDFGAARDFAGDERSMSVMLKKGYAPEEQYRRTGKQGPWTDVYALCATFYRCITGKTPDEALDRLIQDDLVRPSQLGVDITPMMENVLMYGMAIRMEDRCQSMAELSQLFWDALQAGDAPRPEPEPPSPEPPRPVPPSPVPPAPAPVKTRSKAVPAVITVCIIAAAAIAGILIWALSSKSPQSGGSVSSKTAEAATEHVSSDTSSKTSSEASTEAEEEPATERTYDKSGRYSDYEYDSDGNVIKESVYNPDGSLYYYKENEYSSGKLTKSTYHYYDGRTTIFENYNSAGTSELKKSYFPDGKLDYYVEFECSSDGNIITATKYNSDGTKEIYEDYEKYGDDFNARTGTVYFADNTVNYTAEFEYDSSGNMSKETRSYPDKTTIVFDGFNEYNQETKKIKYDADGNIEYSVIFEYDSDGILIKGTCTNSDGSKEITDKYNEYEEALHTDYYYSDGSLYYSALYEYDTSGVLIKKTSTLYDGSKEIWEDYNKFGYATKMTQFDSNGKKIYSYVYTYDNDGNLTKKVTYDADGKVYETKSY